MLVLNKLNEYRKAMSLPELQQTPILNQTAFDHAKYLAINSLFDRDQEEGKKEFTGVTFEDRLKKYGYEGKAREMFCQSDSAVESVDLLFDTIYHRIRLMDPDLKYLGFGSYKSQDKTINVFDFGYIGDNEPKFDWEEIAYPYDKSVNVKTEWSGYENPDPLPPGTVKPLGYPVTVYFKEELKGIVKAELLNANNEVVDSFIITPENDINNKQMNSVIIIPKKILNPSTKYSVNITVKTGANSIEKTYTIEFETGTK